MSKGQMHRLRVAATAMKEELTTKVNRAFEQGSSNYDKLRAARNKAALLETEAGLKEEAEVLNATTATAPAKLTNAADALEAEVARLKAGATRLRQIGDALKAGKEAVDLFEAVN